MPLKTIDLKDEKVVILDQTLLPNEVRYIECETVECIAHAIKRLSIRGAPAIGVAAAFALALTALKNVDKSREDIIKELEKAYDIIRSTRPTAVNLFWALDRVMKVARSSEKPCEAAVKEALRIYHEDIAMNKKLGYYGAELIEDGDVILTHCNAGALATAGYGTALGVIRAAWEQGKRIKVIARETRPLLQGARLTAWELVEEGIPVTVICDSSAGLVMRKHGVTKVIVGADRIASNGDTANKIGTYSLAILAREHRIPFYVAAPTSTIDLNIKTGEEIPIEYRDEKEIIYFNNKRIVAEGAEILNPAFDVTPAKYISAIITERGLITPPYEENIKKVVK